MSKQSFLSRTLPALSLFPALCLSPIQAAQYKVLDYWGVGGYAHSSRPTANTYLDSLAKTLDFELTKTEDAKAFTAANLAQYRVVVLNNSTEMGKVLDTAQRRALMDFMKVKGVIAWHASGDVKGSWPEYTTYLGGELSSHGAGIATVRPDPAGKNHPIIAGLDTARFDEEWYAYKTNPRLAPNVTVLYTLDEKSCGGTTCTPIMGDHPIVWIRNEPTGGRLFYSGMGHMDHIFQKAVVPRTMYKQAMQWAASNTAPIHQVTFSRGNGMMVRATDGLLQVDLTGFGDHALGLRTLDGRLVAEKFGRGPKSYRFPNLSSSAIYTLTTNTAEGRRIQVIR